MTYHMIKYSTIGIISFLLTYGREAVLPIDETKFLMIHECIINIVKEISHIRKEVRLMIQKAQDCIIQQTSGKERRFIVDEEVLYHYLAKES